MIIPADYEKIGITELYVLDHKYNPRRHDYQDDGVTDEIVGKMDGQYFKATCYWAITKKLERHHSLQYKQIITREQYDELVRKAKEAEEERRRHSPKPVRAYPPSYYRKRRRHWD